MTRPRSRFLLLIAFVLVALVALAPAAFAAGLGRLLADLWVATMGAVMGILGRVFGG